MLPGRMPELPEVEVTRRLCETYLVGRIIASVQVQSDPIVFCDQDPQSLERALLGQRIVSCNRKGKYFWWSFEQGALLLHLGMTGAVHVPRGPALTLSHGIDFQQSQWPPRFHKLCITLDNGQALAFCDPRRFGRVRLQSDPLAEAPVSQLGIDPINEDLSFGEFETRLATRKGNIKGLLLNQSFLAGLGNWIADEVLYQARLDPRWTVPQLSETQRRELFEAIQTVLRTAVRVDADATRFPPDWIFHHRWGKKANAVDTSGESIEFLTVAGRSTAWVPSRVSVS